MKRTGLLVAVAMAFLLSHSAMANYVYFFDCVSNTNAADAMIGESQLSVEVIETTAGADFMFRNIGSDPSVISEIFFFDGVLLDLSNIDDSDSGVDFEGIGMPVSPGHLPGYDPSPLQLYEATESEQDAHDGVDPGEWLSVSYTLKSTKTFQDLIDAMTNQELVIGMHVKSFSSGGSESFINQTSYDPNPVPEPATLLLLAVGGLTLLHKRR